MQTDRQTIEEMERLLRDYTKAVEQAKKEGLMTAKTANTYLLHPRNFLRWCKDEFKPGAKNK